MQSVNICFTSLLCNIGGVYVAGGVTDTAVPWRTKEQNTEMQYGWLTALNISHIHSHTHTPNNRDQIQISFGKLRAVWGVRKGLLSCMEVCAVGVG